MLLSPRYSGPTILTIDGDPSDVLAPLVRQRRRLARIATSFSADQWAAPSRCQAWTVRDVVAHLAGINPLYAASALAGLGGEPTRMMPHFDPAESPVQMVHQLSDLSTAEVLDLFVGSNTDLFALVAELDEAGWETRAESPLGDVSIRLLMSHALWDAWVHERDILLPLGIEPAVEADEVIASLRYVVGLTQGFAFGAGIECVGEFGLEAIDPNCHLTMRVSDAVEVRSELAGTGIPVLRGSAVELTEALSTRLPLPTDAPPEWHRLLTGLTYTWDLVPAPQAVR